jgi:hypothetical protein
MAVPVSMIVPMIVPMITVVVIMVVASETIGRLPHAFNLATAGGRGHAAFYCRAAGAGRSWASRRFIAWNCGESVRSEESCAAGVASSIRWMSAMRSCVPG